MGDNERLCVMEPRLRLERFLPQAKLEPGTAKSVGLRLTTEIPRLNEGPNVCFETHTAQICHLRLSTTGSMTWEARVFN